ncbi:hypothetical protein [Foetidibacter luteolus]|uniref:hypothetical protein n=1 Tax=Foetidibacter luteolus TaxID=2608880 RepID=UPI00129AB5CE|nr:hypothetical protein [Foetidibacter luteolus]
MLCQTMYLLFHHHPYNISATYTSTDWQPVTGNRYLASCSKQCIFSFTIIIPTTSAQLTLQQTGNLQPVSGKLFQTMYLLLHHHHLYNISASYSSTDWQPVTCNRYLVTGIRQLVSS